MILAKWPAREASSLFLDLFDGHVHSERAQPLRQAQVPVTPGGLHFASQSRNPSRGGSFKKYPNKWQSCG